MTAVKTAADQQEWNIKSGTGSCTACEKNFEENEDFYTCLTFSEEDVGYVRADYCLACWKDDLKKGALSFWKTYYTPPPPPKEEAMKKETAETALRSQLEKNDPAHANTIFVLAIMLERKRELIEKEVQKNKEGRRVRVYEHKVSGDIFLVTDPELKLDELEKVQKQVAELLGWNEGRITPELIELESFLLCGQNLRTRYKFEKESKTARIPAFWEQFRDQDVPGKIPAAVKGGVLHGLYHRYDSDYRGAYTLTAGLPVTEAAQVPEGLEVIEVPSQAYYRFSVEGPMPQTLTETWPKIWKYFRKVKDYRRAYKMDFERFVAENMAEIYISVLPEDPAKTDS